MSDYASTSSRPASPVADLPVLPNTARPYRFTWDSVNKRPGPGSVSESTEGRGGDYIGVTLGPYGEVHTPLTANAALAGAGLAAGLGADWTSSVHGFHAISTVLNNPHKRAAPPKAHSALPAVAPTDLPRVRRKDFDAYLKSVAPEWERFTLNAEQGREGVPRIGDSDAAATSSGDSEEPRTPRPGQGKPLPPLDSVPDMFFDKEFNIGDPRTFAAVTQHDPTTSTFSTLSETLDPQTYQAALDTLPSYLDTIEQHLIREISARSSSFFAALSNLQDLQAESSTCLTRICSLRNSLKQVDEGTAKQGLEVVQLEGRQRNLGRVRKALGEVGGVVEMLGIARGLVGAGQWGEALDVVEELEMLWDSDAYSQDDTVVDGPSSSTTKESPKKGSSQNGRRSPLPTVEESPPSSPTQPPSSLTQRPPPRSPASRPRTPAAPPSPSLQPQNGSAVPAKPKLSISLPTLHAFSSLPEHLRDLTTQIATSLSTELVSVLRADLLDRIEWAQLQRSLTTEKQMTFEDRLRPLLNALVRTGAVSEAVAQWREVMCMEVKGVVKRHIPIFDLGDDSSENVATSPSAESVKAIKDLDQTIFMDHAQAMYRAFLSCIEGVQAQNTAILEIVDGIRVRHPRPSLASVQDAPPLSPSAAISPSLQEILSTAAELANACAARVLNVRSEEHTKLELRYFYELFGKTWDFVVRSEVISRRMIVGLRGAIVGQSKSFLQAFHQTRLSASAKLVEDEQWTPAEVPPMVQHIVGLIVDASLRDPLEFIFDPPPQPEVEDPKSPPPPSPAPASLGVNGTTIQPSSPVPSPMVPHHNPSSLSAANSGSPASKRRSAAHSTGKHLLIEGRHFFAVSATNEVLVLLADYLKVIINLESLTTDTVSRIIELLKAFNSRTCQVVLGAGAMRSAGLKNITAKHLALASQSLSIMISLIPYLREAFRRHLNQKQAVMLVEFDKLKRDYQEHQNEIHAKLIAIMGDRLNAHIRTLQAVKWDELKEGGGINDYMELLIKETVTLHKVLSRYLSVSVVEYVMTQVFAAINHRLSEEYGNIELPSLEAKNRMLADARYLHEKLTGLKNVRAPTAMLEIVVQEKRVVPPASAALPTSPSPAGNTPLAAPEPKSGSRFAHMFGRVDLKQRTATAPTSVSPARNSLNSDSEKALPALTASPQSRGTSPAPMSPITNGNLKREIGALLSPNGEVVEEPQSMNGEDLFAPPIPPKSPSMSVPMPDSRPGSRPGSRPHSPLPRPEPIPLPMPEDESD